VSGNATLDQPYDYRGCQRSLFCRRLPARHAFADHRGHAAQRSSNCPADPSDPNSQKTVRPTCLGLAVGDTSGSTRVRLFAGPKETDTAGKSIHAIGSPTARRPGQSLEPLIQFGWLTIIAKPLYMASCATSMNVLGPGIGNWGWAIIIFTVIFSLVHAANALHDDEVLAQDDAHSAQG
jgi:membrane protein insertase Oxa1/YidC/SpoIIIJ